MNKTKVYLDTSVISYLEQTDAPEQMQITRNVWRKKMSETTKNIEEIKEPELSPRFDAEDIRKLREYNSLRHLNMTAEEIIAETKAATAEIIAELRKNGNILN